MREALVNYLKENIDDHVEIKKWSGEEQVPLILIEKYNFYEVTIFDSECVFVEELVDSTSINDLKKHMKLIMNKVDVNVVFLFKNISQYKRKNMLKERIPFVIDNGQMYLPFLGLDLSQETKKRLKKVDIFSPIVQLVYLYLLYNENLEINATELANEIGTSRMHAVRALNGLNDLSLLTCTIGGKTGRSKYYKRIANPQYYQIGAEYLKSPIKRLVYIKSFDDSYAYAGLDALAKISLMNPPNRKVIAISKNEVKRIQTKLVKDIDKIKNEELIEVQVWDYDPMFLVKNNVVDILSLAISLRYLNDERVEKAIDECLEGESWYME